MSNEYRIEDNIYVKETDKHGKSLFDARNFAKDELVFVAFGPFVEKATPYTIPVDWKLKIDPTRPTGNLSQYICHSCDPNLGIKERTSFVAFKDIQKDEEILIDYAMIGYEYGDEITDDEQICKCNSIICRGKMGAYKELPEELRRKYQGYVSDYLLEQK